MKHSYGVFAIMVVLGIITSVNGCVNGEGHRGSIIGTIIGNNPLLAYDDAGNLDLEGSLRKIDAMIQLAINIDLGADATESEIEEAHAKADEKLHLLRLAIDYLGTIRQLNDNPEFIRMTKAVEDAHECDESCEIKLE